jgi:hypothetical protein
MIISSKVSIKLLKLTSSQIKLPNQQQKFYLNLETLKKKYKMNNKKYKRKKQSIALAINHKKMRINCF